MKNDVFQSSKTLKRLKKVWFEFLAMHFTIQALFYLGCNSKAVLFMTICLFETKGFPLSCGLMSVVNMSVSDKYGKGSHSLPC